MWPPPDQRLQRTQSAGCAVRDTAPPPLSHYPLARRRTLRATERSPLAASPTDPIPTSGPPALLPLAQSRTFAGLWRSGAEWRWIALPAGAGSRQHCGRVGKRHRQGRARFR
jgi:hypothetical protein